MKLKNGIKILSLADRTAMVDLRAAIPPQVADEQTKKVLEAASLWFLDRPKNGVQDSVPIPGTKPILTEDRYVYAKFRALSQVFLANRGIDFSTPGVLEAAVPLLQGRTVYPNHEFGDIYNWLGVVSNSFWDAAGEKSGGVPGIGCEIKIDAYLNYRIACGLMMTPPAVNSMSLTIFFEFEYSHPQLVEERRFWNLLGEEVDGEIVRMIVTKIREFWEASLVPVGEDRLAKNHGAEDGDEEDPDAQIFNAAAVNPPANSNEEKTMKLTKEQKEELGIEFDGDDVPETEILKAAQLHAAKVKQFDGVNIAELAQLREKAKAGEQFIVKQRDEVTRLAKLAELGAEEGELPTVLAKQIEHADFDMLVELEKYYGDKVAEKFPKIARSSHEDPAAVEGAGGVGDKEPAASEPIGLF